MRVRGCRAVRETDSCESLCRERYDVYAAALPHVMGLAQHVPTIHIDASGSVEEAQASARAALATHRGARRNRELRRTLFPQHGGGGRAGGAGLCLGWGCGPGLTAVEPWAARAHARTGPLRRAGALPAGAPRGRGPA